MDVDGNHRAEDHQCEEHPAQRAVPATGGRAHSVRVRGVVVRRRSPLHIGYFIRGGAFFAVFSLKRARIFSSSALSSTFFLMMSSSILSIVPSSSTSVGSPLRRVPK